MADVNEITKLLPCPFCGTADPLGGSTLDEGCYVMCRNEDCFGMVGYFENQPEADVAWNTRAAPPAMDREAVEDAAREAAYHAIHGPNGDPFQDPEGYDYASKVADAVLSTLSADAIRQGEGGRPSDDALLPFLPDTIEAGRRLGVERSEWLTGWFTSWSPRNDNSNAEGNWSEWVELAHAIIGYDRQAIAALAATPASHASDGGKA